MRIGISAHFLKSRKYKKAYLFKERLPTDQLWTKNRNSKSSAPYVRNIPSLIQDGTIARNVTKRTMENAKKGINSYLRIFMRKTHIKICRK